MITFNYFSRLVSNSVYRPYFVLVFTFLSTHEASRHILTHNWFCCKLEHCHKRKSLFLQNSMSTSIQLTIQNSACKIQNGCCNIRCFEFWLYDKFNYANGKHMWSFSQKSINSGKQNSSVQLSFDRALPWFVLFSGGPQPITCSSNVCAVILFASLNRTIITLTDSVYPGTIRHFRLEAPNWPTKVFLVEA